MYQWDDKTRKAGFLSSFTEAEARAWVLAQTEQELRSSLIRDRGLTPQKIQPGTDGQVMVTDDENGVLYSEWGRVDPHLGISPAVGAKICYVNGGYGQAQKIQLNSFEYADFNTTIYNNGCTIDTSGTGDYTHLGGAVAANPQNNYIQVPNAGRYLLSCSNLWYPPGVNLRVGVCIYNQTTGTFIANEFDHMLTGFNDITVPCTTIAELSAGDKISMLQYWNYGGAPAFHVIAGTNETGRFNWLAVEELSPSS